MPPMTYKIRGVNKLGRNSENLRLGYFGRMEMIILYQESVISKI